MTQYEFIYPFSKVNNFRHEDVSNHIDILYLCEDIESCLKSVEIALGFINAFYFFKFIEYFLYFIVFLAHVFL